jgi:hypothetical protein
MNAFYQRKGQYAGQLSAMTCAVFIHGANIDWFNYEEGVRNDLCSQVTIYSSYVCGTQGLPLLNFTYFKHSQDAL